MANGSEGSRDRFLAATERLFIENGYKGTTIRAICGEAGTSLATLNRNWPSKASLFEEMLQRHFDPLHEQQNKRLEALDNQVRRPELVEVIAAFYGPAFKLIAPMTDSHSSIYSRAMIDPSREIKLVVAKLIDDTRSRLIALVTKALPGIGPQATYIVMNVIFGAYVYPQAFGHQLAVAMAIDDSDFDWSNAASQIGVMLTSGIVAGLHDVSDR